MKRITSSLLALLLALSMLIGMVPAAYAAPADTIESIDSTETVDSTETEDVSDESEDVAAYAADTELTDYVVVGGIKGFEGKQFATFEAAYNAIKPVMETLGLGEDTHVSTEDFDALFTDVTDGKATLTYTITGNVTYDETGLDHLLTMGRKTSHYLTNERHLINFKFKSETPNRGAILTVNSNITLPYEWWGEKVTTSISFENLTITGSAPNGLDATQPYFEGIDFTINNCTLRGIKVYNCSNVGGKYTITNSTLNGTGAPEDAYAIHLQGNESAPLTIKIDNNQISGYDRGINIDQNTAVAEINNNEISVKDNGRSCIQLSRLAKTTVSGNKLALTGGNAITLHECLLETGAVPEITVTGNTITGNGHLIYDDAAANKKAFTSDNLTFTFESTNTVAPTVDKKTGVKGSVEYDLSEIVDNKVNGSSSTGVAKVGETPYATLDEAFSALSSTGYTLTLLNESAWNAATPVYWKAGTQSGYVAKLTDALTAAYMANAGDIEIVCRPGADVGTMTHGHVADNITIYGNNAYISGGECDLEVDTFMFSRSTGAQDTTNGVYLDKDIVINAYELDNLGVWGERHTGYTVSVNLTDCDGKALEKNVQRVYISGTTGKNEITLKNCDFITAATAVYSNADGQISIDTCSFTGSKVPVNFNHKANGEQRLTVSNSTFKNCGDNGEWNQFAAPVRFVNSGSGTQSATVDTCTFAGTVGSNGDILIGDGRTGQESNDVSLTVTNTTATVQAQKPGYYNDTATDTSKGAEMKVESSKTLNTSVEEMLPTALTAYVTVNGGTEQYATLDEAIAAAGPENGVITYTVTGKVNANGESWIQVAKAGLTGLTEVKFVGADANAEICITNSTAVLADQSYDIDVSFKDLTLSHPNGAWVGDLGHATNYFTTVLRNTDAANNTVSYTNCTFPNGACNNQYGKTVYANCKFTNATSGKYNLWNYGGNTEIKNSTFTGTRGIKTYNEGTLAVAPTVKIEGTTFNGLTEKAAVVASKATDITFDNVTTKDCTKGTFQKDIENSGEEMTITANGSGISGSFNITAEKGEEAAKNEFNISAGTFNSEVSSDYCADGFEVKANENGTYGVVGSTQTTKGTRENPYTLDDLSTMTRAEYIEAQTRLGGTMYVTVGDYSYETNGTLGNGTADNSDRDSTKMNYYGAPGAKEGQYSDAAVGKNIVFVGGNITSGVTGYKDVDNPGTSLLLAVPAYTNVTFEGTTFKNVMSFNYQLYTSPWSQLGELKFDGCTFNGIIVGAIAAQTLTFNNCNFGNYTNTYAENGKNVGANNSNPIWVRPAYGNWTKGDNEGQGSDFKSLTTINFTGNTVVSTRPVKFERIAQWEMPTTVTVTGNSFDIRDAGEKKNVGLYFGANAKFDLIADNNKAEGSTAALYTAVYTAPNGTSYAGLPAGSTVTNVAGEKVELDALEWKSDKKLTLKTTEEVASVTNAKGTVVNFVSLSDAIAAAKDGDTVTLLKSCNGNGIKIETKNFATNGLTVDFGGNTYSVGGVLVGSTGTGTNAFQLLEGGKVTFQNGTIAGVTEGTKPAEDTPNWYGAPALVIQNYCDLTLKSMTITGGDETVYTMSNNHGDIVIEDTTINAGGAKGYGYGPFAFDVCGYSSYTGVSVTVRGNSIINGDIEVSRSNANDVKLTLESGKINGKLKIDESIKPGDATTITKSDVVTLDAPSGYKWVDGTLTKITYVAEVNGKTYDSLQAAITEAADGDTITLLADTTEDVVISKNITLDLGGKTLTNTNAGKATISVTSGTVTVKNGNVVGGTSYYNIEVTKDSNANLTLEGVTATAGNTGSSMIDNYGTLTITSGTYTGGLNVVKSEEGSTLTINGGTFTLSYAKGWSYNGVILSAGITNISDGNFIQNATTPAKSYPSVILAMLVEGYTSKIEITGGSFTNNKSDGKIFYGYGKATSDNFEVSGGTFNKSISVDYCADGFIPTKNADGTYGVKEGKYVAQIGSKYYETLSDAIRLAANGKTIELLTDVNEAVTVSDKKNITLDLNGFKLTNAEGTHTIVNNGTLTIKDSSTAQTGTVDNVTHGCGALVNNGTVILSGGTFERSKEKGTLEPYVPGGNSWYTIANYGTMTINKGTIVKNAGGYSSNIRNGGQDSTAKLTINGGTFDGGVNTVKNDANGVLEIKGGELKNTAQYVIMNWNQATISGGTFETAETAGAVLFSSAYGTDGTACGELTITGGTFKAAGSKLIDDAYDANNHGTVKISGGSFNRAVDPKHCDTGFIPTQNEDGTYGVKEGVYVAKVDNVKYETLQAAIDAAKGGSTVRLLANVTLTETAVFPAGKTVHLNLVGHNITATGTALRINGKTDIQSTDGVGTIESTGNVAVAVGDNASLTVYSGTLKGREGAVITGTSTGAKIEIRKNATLIATDNAVIAGNGSKRDGNPNTILVKGGTFNGGIESEGYIACGIYAPWNDSVTVSGGTFNITNGAGIVARAGTVKVTGGTFNCGDGTAKGWVGDSKNNVPNAALVFDKAANYPALTESSQILVSGGTFSTDPAANGAKLADGYVATQTDDMYKVGKAEPVAEINGVKYDTLQAAINAAQATQGGATIALLKNINTESYYTVNGDNPVTIDLAGRNITGSGISGLFYVTAKGDLTIKGEGIVTAVEDNGAAMAVWVRSPIAKVTLEGGTYTQQISNTTDPQFDLIYVERGNVYVKGGTYKGFTPDWTLNCKDENYLSKEANIEVTGGTFYGFDPGANPEGEGTTYVKTGYVSTANTDGTYGVKEGTYVAAIGEKKYATLAAAVDAAQNGDTITLLADVEQNTMLVIKKDITLDLAGKKIFNTTDIWSDANGSYELLSIEAKVTITGNGTIDAKENDCYTINVKNGDLTIENGTFYGNISVVQVEKGTLTINGGKFDLHQKWKDKNTYLINCIDDAFVAKTAKVAIYGGEFVDFDPNVSPEKKIDGKTPSFAAPGVGITKNENNTFTAKPNMVAQIVDADGNSVAAYASLAEAVATAKDNEIVKLLADTDISTTGLTITETITLDLNGYTIEAANTDKGNIKVCGKLTLMDSTDTKKDGTGAGKIFTRTSYKYGETDKVLVVAMSGGTFIMESGLIDAASSIVDNANNGQFAVSVQNDNGDAAVIINGGHIKAGWYAVAGNGTNTKHNGDITVNGGILESTADYAIYHPHTGTTTINGGTIYGAAGGVSLNRGKLVVNGGTITSKGTGSTGDWGDGTGKQDAAAINVNAQYDSTSVEIKGGTITAENDAILLTNGKDGTIAVSGGQFSHEVKAEYCAIGYQPKTTQDPITRLYTVERVSGNAYYVDNNGKPVYGNFVDLVNYTNDATVNKTITLLDNVTVNGYMLLFEGRSVDLSGFELTITKKLIANDGSVSDSSDGKGLLKIAADSATLVSNNGQIPLYDTENQGYRLFNCTIKDALQTISNTSVKLWVGAIFTNKDAYKLLRTGNEHNIKIVVTLRWKNSQDTAGEQTFAFTQSLINKVALTNGKEAFYIVLTGLDTDLTGSISEVTAQGGITSGTGVSISGEEYTLTK